MRNETDRVRRDTHREISIPFPCPNCGQKMSGAAVRLVTLRAVVCDYCGVEHKLKAPDLVAIRAEIAKAASGGDD
jgi:transcription elongation factor Elf1